MASAVLVIDTQRSTLSRIEGACDGVAFKHRWSGIARSPRDGRLYCSPFNANSVLVVDPRTEKITFMHGAGSGDCKWSGIAPGMDGRLYCVPSRANSLLVIDPGDADQEGCAEVARLFHEFEGQLGKGNSKWSGLCVGLDRQLFCVPYNSSHTLTINGAGRGTSPNKGRSTSFSHLSAAALADLLGSSDPEGQSDEASQLQSCKKAIFDSFMSMVQVDDAGQRTKRYRQLCRDWHPDKHPMEDRQRATALFQFLQQLHERCIIV